MPTDAVIICTRNRPSDLARTLDSVAQQQGAAARFVLVVDASDPAVRTKNETVVDQRNMDRWTHLPYDAAPSLPRQRNYGIARLPEAVDVVHFLDDDVTLHAGYFQVLAHALRRAPALGGVGGITYQNGRSASRVSALFRRLFLLDGPPGAVLPSGHVSSAQCYSPSESPPDHALPTSFLSGCSSSYSREVLRRMRFDPTLKTHAYLEDLDFSYRVSQSYDLRVRPDASLVHHRSPQNRAEVATYAEQLIRHRYWFVRKHDLSQIAFWWSALGQLLARLASSHPAARSSLRGLLRGLSRIWHAAPPHTA